jgi:hypothetical protein
MGKNNKKKSGKGQNGDSGAQSEAFDNNATTEVQKSPQDRTEEYAQT